jgi:hypothetical protein
MIKPEKKRAREETGDAHDEGGGWPPWQGRLVRRRRHGVTQIRGTRGTSMGIIFILKKKRKQKYKRNATLGKP